MASESLTILLLEDEPAHAEVISRVLYTAFPGIRVIVHESAHRGQEYLKSEGANLIISDLNLRDGFLLDNIADGFGNLPLLLMTAYGDEQVAVRAMKSGALDYIVKSEFSFRELPKTVQRVLRQWNEVQERKLAEAKLKESELRNRALVEALPDMLFMFTSDGVIVDYKAERQDNLLMKPEEFLGKNVAEIFPPFLVKLIYQSMERLRQDEGVVTFDYEMTIGAAKWFESRVVKYGEKLFLAVVRDITLAKDAEKALKASEEQYRTLIEIISDGIAFIDADEKIVLMNPAGARMFGLTQEKIIGRSLLDFCTPATKKLIKLQTARRRAGFRDEYQMEIIRPNGEHRFLNTKVSPTFNASGEFIGSSGTFQDVTDLRNAEKALKESEEYYRAVIETSPDGFWVTDVNGKILEVNDVYIKRSGYTREELLKMYAWDLDVNEYPEDTQLHMDKIKVRGAEVFETQHRTKDGTTWQVEIDVSYWDKDDGRFFAFIKDIYRRKRSEQLIRTRLRLSEMALHGDVDSMIQAALDAAELFTSSRIGFFHFVDENQRDLKLQTWSTNTTASMCKADGKGLHYAIADAGVWVDCFHQKKAVIHNDYVALPHKKGLPEGHAPVIRELVVPVIQDEKVTAILGVGNKTTPYNDEDVRVIEDLASIVMDVVARKNTEDALRASETRLRMAMSAARQGLYDLTIHTGEAKVSSEYPLMLGYDPDTFSENYESWKDRLHPDDKDRTLKLFSDYMQGTVEQYDTEFRQKTNSGNYIWVHSVGKIVQRDADGKPLRILGIHTDITERKSIQLELLKKDKMLAAIMRATDELLSNKDYRSAISSGLQLLGEAAGVDRAYLFENSMGDNGTPAFGTMILEWNSGKFPPHIDDPQFQLLPYAAMPDEFSQLQKGIPFYASYHQIQSEILLTIFETNQIQSILVFPLFVGDVMWGIIGFDECKSPRIWTPTEVSLLNSFCNSVSKAIERADNERLLEIAKERAEQMSRLKSNFLANMSHEIRTPMIGILGYAELIKERMSDPVSAGQAAVILQSGHRLLETLNLILDLSRIESDKLEVNLSKVDVLRIIDEIRDLFAEAASKKELFLITEYNVSCLNMMLDERMFSEVLTNLVNNAIKYTRKGGITIRVNLNSVKKHVVISVEDTGIGIAQADQEIIWDEFRQVSEGRSRAFEGTGLGLTITKRFVEKLNGTITLQSQLGLGSEFIVTLPLTTECKWKERNDTHQTEGNEDIMIESYKPETPHKVLIIEDEETSADVMQLFLSEVAICTHCYDGKTGIETAKNGAFDAVLLDINLGSGNSGLTLLPALRAIPGYATVPVIAVTAYAMVGDREEFLRAGCDGYVSKPFSKNELLTALIKGLKAYQR